MYSKIANTSSASAPAAPAFDSARTDATFAGKPTPKRDFAPDIGFPDTNMNGLDQLRDRDTSFKMVNLGNGKWRIDGIEVYGKNLEEAMRNWSFVSGNEPRPL